MDRNENSRSTRSAHSVDRQEASRGANSSGPKAQKHGAGAELFWAASAQTICCINSYPNGISLSIHSKEKRDQAEGEKHFKPQNFYLRFRDTRDYQLPDGRFYVYKTGALASLERHLSTLHKQELLQRAVVYFGTTTDPFMAFHRRFDHTNGTLQLLEQYRPERLVVQTRSPLVIAALPTLKLLEDRSVVTIPIETSLEKSIQRYTPGMPRIGERLLAAQGLRRQGIRVHLSAAPLLPYGNPQRDAWDFAELLDRHADYLSVGCLASGDESEERHLRELPLARRLEADEQFHFLRPQAYQHLLHALQNIAPEKLAAPVPTRARTGQLALFAA